MGENIKNKEKELQNVIENHLDRYVKVPAFETIEKDFYAQDKIAGFLILLKVTTSCIIKYGLDFDKNQLQKLPQDEIEKHITVLEEYIQTGHLSQETEEILKSNNSNKHLIFYLNHGLNWIVISILSASYISANIIMRSIFELLVAIATNGIDGKISMGSRLDSISFLTLEERKKLRKLWGKLNSWVHPSGKWEKEVCPIFVSRNPMYHPELCGQSLDLFEKLIDFFIIIGIEKFEINRNDILDEIQEYQIDISNLTLFQNRFQ